MKRPVSAILAAIALLMPLLSSTAHASPEHRSGIGESPDVWQFVERVRSRWGIHLNSSDYEVHALASGKVVKPKGSARVVERIAHGEDSTQVTLGTAQIAPEMPAGGEIGVQQDTIWRTPTCYARIGDSDGVGWMDTCAQWGHMNYSGSTGRNYAFRMYASCGAADPGHTFKEVDECYVSSARASNSSPLLWNDWSPKSTTNLSNCGTIQLQVAAGPVAASASVNTCETLEIMKGAEGGTFRATWVGDSYYPEEVRETGSLIAFKATDMNLSAILWVEWNYVYSECHLSGIIDRCG